MIYCECNGDAQLALFVDDAYGEANNADEDWGCSPEDLLHIEGFLTF